MNDAVAINPNLPLVESASFGGRMAALPLRSKLSLGIGIAALAGVVLAMTLWSSKGDFKVLYANLSDKDGGAVIAQLSQMNVPYRMSEGGGAIMVPAAQVHDLRLKLATAGLPKGTVSGYELMDSARFGQTQFQERLTAQRGLEGELTRSITSLAAVENARVHLALPNQNGFFREQQKPSASVLLTLRSGRTLDRAQIAGIVHLVSSSVPELDPKAVSVLDQTGALLTSSGDGSSAPGLDAQQLQYVNQIETGYAKRIFDLLEPIVGRDNLRATVTADVDFSQSEATSEEFRPNQGTEARIAIRSQQVSEQNGSAGAQPSGIPGAASNQPPIAATAPLQGASQPLQTAQGGNAGGASGRRDATTNYEVDKTVRVTRNASGNVKRLNAAVVVNNRSVTDSKGKTTQVALAPEEIDKLTALVRETIGYSKERGDSVKVINAPFKIETSTPLDLPLWKQPETIDLLRSLAVPVGLALVALLVFFGLVRPALKAALAPSTASPMRPGLSAVVDDPQVLPALPAPKSVEHLAGARQLAKDNPAAVAGIVRGWVNGESVPAKG
ncbi:MAG: flagellar M-ring protein FliF [Pseudomonadota bacterium]|nr:flagellar M-ring protein FliF [Pseudomonadota bacterium]